MKEVNLYNIQVKVIIELSLHKTKEGATIIDSLKTGYYNIKTVSY